MEPANTNTQSPLQISWLSSVSAELKRASKEFFLLFIKKFLTVLMRNHYKQAEEYIQLKLKVLMGFLLICLLCL